MKTILVPIDFSTSSENSAGYASEIATLEKAKVILFHVCSAPVPVADVPVTVISIDELEKRCLADLKALKKKLQAEYKNIEFETIVRTGFIVEEILLEEEELKPGIIVMGVEGKDRTADVFGSNTTAVIKKAKCPVLVIPSGKKYKKPVKIALACDYNSTMPDSVTDKLKYFVKLFGARLMIFDVLKPTEVVTYQKAVAEVNLENTLGELQHSIFYPSGENMEEETNQFIEKNNVDMLIMVPHNYSFLNKLFHRSKTKKMALHTNVPLLSIHE